MRLIPQKRLQGLGPGQASLISHPAGIRAPQIAPEGVAHPRRWIRR